MPAPNRTCKQCGKPFYTVPARLKSGRGIYCSKECMISDPEHWKKGVETRKQRPLPPETKAIISKAVSESNRRRKISEETRQKMIMSHSGERNHFFGKTHNPTARHKMSEIRKTMYSGSNNPFYGKTPTEKHLQKIVEKEIGGFWYGNIRYYNGPQYCEKWTEEFKERVRVFFGHQCQECGHVWQEGKRRLSVHHVNFNKKACCDNSTPLFVPLCGRCHTKTNTNRIFWKYWFTELITRYYDGKCYFTKEETSTEKDITNYNEVLKMMVPAQPDRTEQENNQYALCLKGGTRLRET